MCYERGDQEAGKLNAVIHSGTACKLDGVKGGEKSRKTDAIKENVMAEVNVWCHWIWKKHLIWYLTIILICKLKLYDFHENVIELLKDYFYLRSQITVINGNESAVSFIKHGVAQGSLIGPLLLILYLNYLPKVV